MTDVAPAEAGQPLGHAVSHALGWSTAAEVFGRVGSFAVGIVLARLLTEEDFGVYAVTLVAVNLLMVVNDLGVIAAVVRWRGDVREAARTAVVLSVSSSLLFFGAACLVADPFARALGSPDAGNLVRLLAVVVLIDGLSGAHLAVLVRTFRNDRIAVAELGGFLVGTPVTLGLAATGLGPWSIVVGRVVGAIAVSALVIRAVPFPIRPALDRVTARALLRFGGPLALSALVAQAVLNVDYIIVGNSLGAVELGVYLLAFNLSSWPTSLVSTALARVSFAGMSRLVEDRSRLVYVFPRSIGVAVSALVPLVAILAVLAPELIRTVYGERWSAAATPLRFLLVLGGLRVLVDLFVDLTIADGRPSTALGLRVVWLVAAVPALAIGAALDGLRGVGIAHAVVASAVVLPLLLLDARRSAIRTADVVRHAARPLAAGAVCVAAMWPVLAVLDGDLSRLVVAGACGGLVYLTALLPGNPLVRWVVSVVRPTARVEVA